MVSPGSVGIDERRAGCERRAVLLEHRVDQRGEQRMPGAEQLGSQPLSSVGGDAVLVERDSLVAVEQRPADCDFAVAGSNGRRHSGDLEAAGLARRDAAAELVERGGEERLDEPGLELAGEGLFHAVADLADPVVGSSTFDARARSSSTVFERLPISPSIDLVDDGERPSGPCLADGFDQQVLEGPVDLGVAEHVVDLVAVHAALLFDLLEQPLEHHALAGAVRDEVPEVAELLLADAVDAAEALLDPVRVPRQVVVDHQVRALQVDALAGGVGRDEHLHGRVVAERVLDPAAVLALARRRGSSRPLRVDRAAVRISLSR